MRIMHRSSKKRIVLGFAALTLALASCDSKTREPADTLMQSDTSAASFIADYSGLAKLSDGGVLLYPSDRAEVINQLRSALPTSNPLYEADEAGTEDRILVRMRLPNESGRSYFVAFTEGPSGDPGFYLIDAETLRETGVEWGEVLALPASGEFMMFQRANTFFAKRKRIRVADSGFVEIPEARYRFVLRSIALDSSAVFRSEQDSTPIARLARGDSLTVTEVAENGSRGFYPVWIRTAKGISGLVRLPMSQCPATLIRGLCFAGD